MPRPVSMWLLAIAMALSDFRSRFRSKSYTDNCFIECTAFTLVHSVFFMEAAGTSGSDSSDEDDESPRCNLTKLLVSRVCLNILGVLAKAFIISQIVGSWTINTVVPTI